MAECRVRIIWPAELGDFVLGVDPTDDKTVRLSVHIGMLVKSVELSAVDAALMCHTVMLAASEADESVGYALEVEANGSGGA